MYDLSDKVMAIVSRDLKTKRANSKHMKIIKEGMILRATTKLLDKKLH